MKEAIRPPADLKKFARARDQLQQAAQIIPALGRAFVEPEPDDSHTNAGWDDERWALVSRPVVSGSREFRVGIEVGAPAVLFYSHDSVESFALDGVTFADVETWLSAKIRANGLDPSTIVWEPDYDLAEHPVRSQGAAFGWADLADSLEELASWFSLGFKVLDEVATSHGAGAPRCWPHHFDVGTLKLLGANADGEAMSVGVGLSPGDGYYAEPYFYASPWPAGEPEELPDLEYGVWHTEGFVSAVLTASAIDLSQDSFTIRDFFEESIAAGTRHLT